MSKLVTGEIHWNIPGRPSCWDRFTSSNIPPNWHYQIIHLYRLPAFMDQSSQHFPHL